MSNEPAWKTFNKTAAEIVKINENELERVCKEEPHMAAAKLLELARNDTYLRQALYSDAWHKYHQHRSEWLKTFNAALNGLLANNNTSMPRNCIGTASSLADEIHKPLPPEPER